VTAVLKVTIEGKKRPETMEIIEALPDGVCNRRLARSSAAVDKQSAVYRRRLLSQK
jgi:hypothetical protein